MKILVVDDDECFLDRMKTVLELDNQSITIATSGNEALNKVRQFKFDLILTDLKMPDLSGIELLKKAREMGNTSIFIVITGFGTIESAVDAIKAGAYDYLLKPFKFPILQEKIREVEQDLLLREKLKFSKIEESNVDNSDFKSIKGGLEPPFLVISDQNPETLIKKFNLIEVIPIWLNSEKWSEAISQPNLDVLKSTIVDYVENNSKGTIIFNGIEKLTQIQNWENIQEFLIFVQTEIRNLHIQLIIMIEDRNGQTQNNQILSFLTTPAFDKIIELISHPIRKNIINNLKFEHEMTFKKIVQRLSIESPSVLSFHLRKLVKEDILIKTKNFNTTIYYLSSKGAYLANIIFILEDLGEVGPFSPIKVVKKPKLTKILP